MKNKNSNNRVRGLVAAVLGTSMLLLAQGAHAESGWKGTYTIQPDRECRVLQLGPLQRRRQLLRLRLFQLVRLHHQQRGQRLLRDDENLHCGVPGRQTSDGHGRAEVRQLRGRVPREADPYASRPPLGRRGWGVRTARGVCRQVRSRAVGRRCGRRGAHGYR